jgi:hypothetical protein
MFIFPFSNAQKVLSETRKENPYGADFVYDFSPLAVNL